MSLVDWSQVIDRKNNELHYLMHAFTNNALRFFLFKENKNVYVNHSSSKVKRDHVIPNPTLYKDPLAHKLLSKLQMNKWMKEKEKLHRLKFVLQ